MPDPRIPDDAMYHALRRIGTWLDVTVDLPSDEAIQRRRTTSFGRSDWMANYDKRALDLSAAVLGHFRNIEPEQVPPEDVSVAVFGISLGLLLAEATGWEPPITEPAP